MIESNILPKSHGPISAAEFSIDKSLLKNPFIEEIMNNFPGSILVTDNTGKIIFVFRNIISSINQDDIVGMNIRSLVDSSLLSNCPTVKAIETHKTEISYIGGKVDNPVFTISIPTFDYDGNLDKVFAFSYPEFLMEKLVNDSKRLKSVFSYINKTTSDKNAPITNDTTLKALLAFLKKIADNDETVLLFGESGTGKDVISRYIHQNSRRKDFPFIPVNCTAIPEQLIESEFFGYERGSFTGANKEGKIGLFEMADGGTLFLDEIEDIPLSMQGKLLRVLESGEIRKIGSNVSKQVDTRVLVATNADLKKKVSEGSFRGDLYYRLNVIPIFIPPLRQRRGDIVLLAEHFLDKKNKKNKTLKSFSQNCLEKFKSYSWPGNVRELKNVVERLYLLSDSDTIEFVKTYWPDSACTADTNLFEETDLQDDISLTYSPLKESLRNYEKQLILKTYAQCGNNASKTAQKLGIHLSGLYQKLAKYKI